MSSPVGKKENTKQGKEGHPESVHEEVITTHVNADFDALASMIAAGKLYPEAALVFPGSQEKNLRNFFIHKNFNFFSKKFLFIFKSSFSMDFHYFRSSLINNIYT